MDREKTLGSVDRALGGARKVSFSSATPPLVNISSVSSPRQECKKEVKGFQSCLKHCITKMPCSCNKALPLSQQNKNQEYSYLGVGATSFFLTWRDEARNGPRNGKQDGI